MLFLVNFVLFLSLQLTADDQLKVKIGHDPVVDVISDKYEAGAYLIYDCLEKHWVCVLEEYYRRCEAARKSELVVPDESLHTCAPIGEFPNKISCFQRQLFLTTHNHGARFCLKISS
jgi:hypothetical protein